VKVKPSLHEQLQIDTAEAVSGGCIHRCYRVLIAGKARFLKTNAARHAEGFAAEADGLGDGLPGARPARARRDRDGVKGLAHRARAHRLTSG
jgi:hypothetical protein